MIKKFTFFAYCCDKSNFRGEGILCLSYLNLLKKILKSYKFVIYCPVKNKKKINHNFFYKYSSPIYGIFKIWSYHLRGYNTLYINFLPLWNFMLFLFLPKKTLLGPITGGNFQGSDHFLLTKIRKILLKNLYKISIYIILKKNIRCIFSTSLLKNYLPLRLKKRSLFNFQVYGLKILNFINCNKEIDILYYNRNHFTKKNKKVIKLLHYLKSQYSILIVGDNLKGFKNVGTIRREKVIQLLKKTKLTFGSQENNLSFFNLDAISSGVKIITLNRDYPKLLKNFFFYMKDINYNNFKKIYNNKIIIDSKFLNKKIKKNDNNVFEFIKNYSCY